MQRKSRLRIMMEAREKEIFEWALAESGTVSGAAELLEIDRAHVYKKLTAYGIPTPERRGKKSRSNGTSDKPATADDTNDDDSSTTDPEIGQIDDK